MTFTTAELEAAKHLLGHYGVPGYPKGGSFTTKFIECMEAADPNNRARLLLAFPAYRIPASIAVTIGVEELQRLIESQEKKAAKR